MSKIKILVLLVIVKCNQSSSTLGHSMDTVLVREIEMSN